MALLAVKAVRAVDLFVEAVVIHFDDRDADLRPRRRGAARERDDDDHGREGGAAQDEAERPYWSSTTIA